MYSNILDINPALYVDYYLNMVTTFACQNSMFTLSNQVVLPEQQFTSRYFSTFQNCLLSSTMGNAHDRLR